MTWVDRLKRQNKIRDRFKRERMDGCTLAQNKLFDVLKIIGKKRQFKPVLEREIYTKNGVRFSDIFISKYGLNIEVDGGYHFTEDQKVKDIMREKEIWDKKRIITIRFINEDIINRLDVIAPKLESLMNELDKLPHFKCPGKGKKKFNATVRRKQLCREWNLNNL
ncbi:MAG TPA: hypothetical protein P5262_03095 [Candidatus Moranbacteria bacterium]|nr:hypothetical protein [Candidatus Moranbacteria bacterium]